jgi:hypothetical protein
MKPGNPKIIAINARNKAFWAAESKELERRIQRPDWVKEAIHTLEDELRRMVPAKNTHSLESAIASAERTSDRFAGAQARIRGAAGGRSRRLDPLNELIEAAVSRRPAISCEELLGELKADAPGAIVEEVTAEMISYVAANGKLMEVPVSGLKDRLSRARKKIGKRSV